MCWAVILGNVDIDLELLEVGPICHSRWLTLACRILRYYVSFSKPSSNLSTLAQFCIKVYFPSWFQIKQNHAITEGAKNLFGIIEKIEKFPNKRIKDISMKVIQRNAFFAHPENVLLAMMGDEDADVRRIAVNKIQAIRGNLPNFVIESGQFDSGTIEQSDEEDQPSASSNLDSEIRRFLIPKLNTNAKVYHKLVNLNSPDVTEPPATKQYRNDEIEIIRNVPLVLKHPCHNQAVERHVKLVTEASSAVAGFERRDGLIRQKIKSRKLMKCSNRKNQFN